MKLKGYTIIGETVKFLRTRVLVAHFMEDVNEVRLLIGQIKRRFDYTHF
jgi:hypothetical protein